MSPPRSTGLVYYLAPFTTGIPFFPLSVLCCLNARFVRPSGEAARVTTTGPDPTPALRSSSIYPIMCLYLSPPFRYSLNPTQPNPAQYTVPSITLPLPGRRARGARRRRSIPSHRRALFLSGYLPSRFVAVLFSVLFLSFFFLDAYDACRRCRIHEWERRGEGGSRGEGKWEDAFSDADMYRRGLS
ncbi:hypothetical protein C8Q78DRAFT_614031 [Trametes maxima]|nr:hypothetical protein C8Q78DRAFT_614031 [Trametes maxima]